MKIMPKKLEQLSAEHERFLHVATRRTTPVVTYRATGGTGEPVTRGTGFFLEHGARAFVVTNTHVLEEYAAAKKDQKKDAIVHIQIWSGEGETGSEFHDGCLVMPNAKTSVELGVPSGYDHKDVGLIELTPTAASLARREKEFVKFEQLSNHLPALGSVVFYKGYPAKSAEFHGDARKSLFGQWLDIRKVDRVSSKLIIAHPPLQVYRSSEFPEEEGKDLKGISGSALMGDDHEVVGVVWGSADSSVASAIYAVPAALVKELVVEYEKRSPKGR